jgi:hypothetical protein
VVQYVPGNMPMTRRHWRVDVAPVGTAERPRQPGLRWSKLRRLTSDGLRVPRSKMVVSRTDEIWMTGSPAYAFWRSPSASSSECRCTRPRPRAKRVVRPG